MSLFCAKKTTKVLSFVLSCHLFCVEWSFSFKVPFKAGSKYLARFCLLIADYNDLKCAMPDQCYLDSLTEIRDGEY